MTLRKALPVAMVFAVAASTFVLAPISTAQEPDTAGVQEPDLVEPQPLPDPSPTPDTTVGDDPPETLPDLDDPAERDFESNRSPELEGAETLREPGEESRRRQREIRSETRNRARPAGADAGGLDVLGSTDRTVVTYDFGPDGELRFDDDLDPDRSVLELSLEDAVELALRRNLSLVIERLDRRQAELQLLAERGIYDLRLGATFEANDIESRTFNSLEANSISSTGLSVGVSQLNPFGGDATLGVAGSRDELSSNTVNPTFDGDFTFSYLQPLLRDFGRLPTERGIRLARIDSSISLADLENQISQTLLDVHNAYWALIDSGEQLVVAREARSLAVQLDDRNRIEVEVGTRAPLELVQSEATIALRDEGIITSETFLGDAEDVLRQLLDLPPRLWQVPIRPITEAETAPTEIDLAEAFQTAVAERPELAVQRLLLERAGVDVDFFRNQTLPRLDFRLDYGLDGTAARGVQQVPDGPDIVLDGDILDAFDSALSGEAPFWTARLTFSYPLQNRSARAAREIAEVSREQAVVQLEQLEQSVLTEVRSAVRAVNSAVQQIRSARVSRELQEKNLEAEQKRYENGMSTSFQVSEIQDDLTQARSREVSALTNYRLALARYHDAVGRLVEESGVELAETLAPREPMSADAEEISAEP